MKRIYLLLFTLLFTQISSASNSKNHPAPFNANEIAILKTNLFNNITPQGAIIASPSNYAPNYSYDWIRDSAIAMNLIASWYERDKLHENKSQLLNYVTWTEQIQHQPDPNPLQDILGEPKFNLDGTPYSGPWGRPQNDGPALRALALIRFATTLLNGGDLKDIQYVSNHLYSNSLDPNTMGTIKMDLEYIAHHWQEKNYDLWEEVYGNHFFTEMVQQNALIEGAKLAKLLDDPNAADYYQLQAQQIDTHLEKFIDHQNHVIRATLPPHPGPQKTLELDSAVLLGVLLSNPKDQHFSVNNFHVQNTVTALENQFATLFPINQTQKTILMGRYPGDTYDGYRSDSLGNPWFILTAAMAEYYYTQAKLLPNTPPFQHQITNFIAQGDDYLTLIKYYAPDLTMKEQINRSTGVQQGAESLTWNYVALLRAIEARPQI